MLLFVARLSDFGATASTGNAQILCVVFLVLFVAALLMLSWRRRIP
ncbi:DUF1328 domain-containing protein [Marinovum sp.]|nr:DUF1328 domain-containing protein [Marinovum sp.]